MELDYRQQIHEYLDALPPEVLGVPESSPIKILNKINGAYNLNYVVRVNTKKFIFRINIDQQSGLNDQIEYEYHTLKFLEPHRIAPKAYHLDNTGRYFTFGILIEEYLNGPHLRLEHGQINEVAELLTRLHSLDYRAINIVTWKNPLTDNYAYVENDIRQYESRKNNEKKLLNLTKRVMEIMKPRIAKRQHVFHADCLNHTDVACDNFVRTPKGFRMIDWEKPRVDDRSYDISCFLSKLPQKWCSPHVLTTEESENFLQTYANLSEIEADILREKVILREPLVSLHWILWAATKLCDLRSRLTVPELVPGHQDRIIRFQKVADPANVEEVLDSL